jgi:hypothetical protein
MSRYQCHDMQNKRNSLPCKGVDEDVFLAALVDYL